MRQLIIILSILYFADSIAQNNYSWSLQDSEWTYLLEGQRMDVGGYLPSSLKRIIKKSTDSTNTSANSQFYYNTYSFSHTPMETGATFLNSYVPYENYEFALFNDVMYYKQPLYTNDTINWIPADDTIANFNASIGDFWSFHDPYLDPFFVYDNGTSGITTVSDTGSRVINGVNLKWILVEHQITDETLIITNSLSYSDTIFERIGPKRNMIPSEYFYGFDSNFNGGCRFACYSDINFTEYTVLQNVCDYHLTSSKIYSNQSSIYPNPCFNEFTIEYDGDIPNLKLYNQSGQIIDMEVNSKNNGILNVNVESVPAGFYIIQFEENNRNYSQRLIITK